MHVVIIGGSGHVGTYLVPRLVEAGYSVTNVSRSQSEPYLPHKAWQSVHNMTLDRTKAEADGTFGQQIRDLKPDIIIDMICFTLESCQHLVKAVQGEVQHFLHCGTVWIHGHSAVVPTTEDQPRQPFGEYGIQKSAIEIYLREMARKEGFPATALHPGHIVGPGHDPINPAGNKDMTVFETIARGDELVLPNIGMETVHHVHADDVAQIFMQAITYWTVAVGESFHVVSPAALTLRGFAEAMYRWFGHEPKLSYLGWEEWRKTVSPEHAQATWDHIAHSPNASIAKAQRLLNYQPRYTSLEAIYESVQWLIDNGKIQVGK
jgi:nucleoside-diphosphate-sugar epimerase